MPILHSYVRLMGPRIMLSQQDQILDAQLFKQAIIGKFRNYI